MLRKDHRALNSLNKWSSESPRACFWAREECSEEQLLASVQLGFVWLGSSASEKDLGVMVSSDLGTSHRLPGSQEGQQHPRLCQQHPRQQIKGSNYFFLLGIHETAPRIRHPVLAPGQEQGQSCRTSPGEGQGLAHGSVTRYWRTKAYSSSRRDSLRDLAADIQNLW